MVQEINVFDFDSISTEASGQRFPNDGDVLHVTINQASSNDDRIITFKNDGNTLLITEWESGRTAGISLTADVTGTFHALGTDTSYSDDIELTLSGTNDESHLHGPFPTVYFGDEVTVRVTGTFISSTSLLRLGAIKR